MGTLPSLAALVLLALRGRASAQLELQLFLALAIAGAVLRLSGLLGALEVLVIFIPLVMQLFLEFIERLLIPNLEFLGSDGTGELIAEYLSFGSLLLDVLFDLGKSLFEAFVRLDVALEHAIFFVFIAVVIFCPAHLVLLAELVSRWLVHAPVSTPLPVFIRGLHLAFVAVGHLLASVAVLLTSYLLDWAACTLPDSDLLPAAVALFLEGAWLVGSGTWSLGVATRGLRLASVRRSGLGGVSQYATASTGFSWDHVVLAASLARGASAHRHAGGVRLRSACTLVVLQDLLP